MQAGSGFLAFVQRSGVVLFLFFFFSHAIYFLKNLSSCGIVSAELGSHEGRMKHFFLLKSHAPGPSKAGPAGKNHSYCSRALLLILNPPARESIHFEMIQLLLKIVVLVKISVTAELYPFFYLQWREKKSLFQFTLDQ